MAPRYPVVSGKATKRALERAGFSLNRIVGSHHVMRKTGEPTRNVTVPIHGNRDLRRKTLKAILAQAGLSVDEFLTLL